LARLCGQRELVKAKDLWENSMKTLKRRPSPTSLSIMTDVYSRLLEREKAEEVFRRIQKPSQRDYFHMLALYKTLGDAQAVVNTFKEAEERFKHIPPLRILYEVAMDFYGEREQVTWVAKIFDRFLERGGAPTVKLYTSLIAAYVRVGNMKMAEHTFQRLAETPGLDPNRVTYTVMLQMYIRNENLRKVQEILDRVTREEISLDEPAYAVIIRAFRRTPEKAEQFFSHIQHIANEHIFSAIIRVHADNQNYERAEDLWSTAIERGIEPTRGMMFTMFLVYYEQGKHREAVSLYEERGRNFQFKENVYVLLIRSYSNLGNFTGAFSLHAEQRDKGLSLKGQHSMTKAMLDYQNQMSRGELSRLFKLIISHCLLVYEPHQAFNYLKKLGEIDGGEISLPEYERLILLLSKARAHAQIIYVYLRMERAGVVPSLLILEEVIPRLCFRDPEKAERLFNTTNFTEPSLPIWEAMSAMYVDMGRKDLVQALMANLKEKDDGNKREEQS
jgi:pentatricopeptide repeat protein